MAALQYLLPMNAFAFAVPNGGNRSLIEAVNLKRQGVKAGVPDIIIIYGGKAHGLELKAKAGKVSDSQKVTFPLMRGAGMRIEVARDFHEAITLIGEMGIPLRTNDNRYAVKDVFREETRRRA